MSGNAATVYTWTTPEFPINFLVAFANDVSIPIRNVHNEVARTIRNALTAQPAVWRKTRRKRQLFFFAVRHLGNTLQPFSDNGVTSGACTDPAAGMIDPDTVG